MFWIEKYLSRFSKFCGFRLPGEREVDPMQELMRLLNEDTKGAIPLSHMLLYDYTIDGIFYNKDSLGIFFEIDPIIGSNEAIEKNLTLFFTDHIPEHGHLQFLVVADTDIRPAINCWEKGRGYGGELIKKMTRYRKRFIEDLAVDFASNEGRLVRNYRFFVSFSIKKDVKNSLEVINKFKSKLYNKLKTERLGPNLCYGADLIEIAGSLLQMELKKDDRRKRYDVINDLPGQIVEPLTPNTVLDKGIIHHKTGLMTKMFSVKELPPSFSLGQMINLLGDDKRSIPGRFAISYTISNNLGKSGTSAI